MMMQRKGSKTAIFFFFVLALCLGLVAEMAMVANAEEVSHSILEAFP